MDLGCCRFILLGSESFYLCYKRRYAWISQVEWNGHSANYGDRFSLVKGASPSKGAKPQYYPISPPQKDVYNPGRDAVNFNNLPLQGQRQYWATIEKLNSATIDEQKRIMKSTGISWLAICATSPAFLHPSFFPLDPFHLFYENCMPHF